jgi:hypothetical protein
MRRVFLGLVNSLALSLAVTCGALAAQGPDQVIVTNPVTLNPATPNPVTIVSPPKITPYVSFLDLPESPGNLFVADFASPPAGKLLVVEYFGAACFSLDNAQISFNQLELVDIGPTQPIPYPVNLTNAVVGPTLQVSQAMRFYVNSGDRFEVSAQFHGQPPNSVECTFTASGQLVDQP